jgi:hypothetical protein
MVTIIPFLKLKDQSLIYFKAIIETLASLLDENYIYALITTNGLIIYAKNDLEISVKLSLPKEFFFEYLVNSNYAFSLSIKFIGKIFERPLFKETIIELAYLQEFNRLTIIFLDKPNSHDSSIFELPIFNYDPTFERIEHYDNSELYNTDIILKEGKKTLYFLFGDQKYVDFEKDIQFELYTNPDLEILKITTVTNNIEFPKAKTTIKGPLALTVINQLLGPESTEIYDIDLIRSLNKLDPVVYQLNLFYHTNAMLFFQFNFLHLANCFMNFFIYPINPE